MPAKALTRSAVSPAGPVTKVCIPAGADAWTSSRSSLTTSFTSPEEAMGTTNWTALASSDGMGPIDRAADLQGLQLALERRGLAELGRSEGGVALDHDDGGDLLGVPELGLPVLGLGGFRPGGQEGCLVVGRDLTQPAEGGAADAGDGQPGDDEHSGNQPAQPERDAGRRVAKSCFMVSFRGCGSDWRRRIDSIVDYLHDGDKLDAKPGECRRTLGDRRREARCSRRCSKLRKAPSTTPTAAVSAAAHQDQSQRPKEVHRDSLTDLGARPANPARPAPVRRPWSGCCRNSPSKPTATWTPPAAAMTCTAPTSTPSP